MTASLLKSPVIWGGHLLYMLFPILTSMWYSCLLYGRKFRKERRMIKAGWKGKGEEQRCNGRLLGFSTPLPGLFPFFLRDGQGCFVAWEVAFWFCLLFVSALSSLDFYPGDPISSLQAPGVKGQKGIFPVNILWAAPGKGNQQPPLPVFILILRANNTIFYFSTILGVNGRTELKWHRITNILLLRILLFSHSDFLATKLFHIPGFH